ncbi:fructose-6-phosphate aldolase [Streptococcus respiraculi]|uniref:fructose-6-phosphate aldolase n=1 Tax=Streptococcus respiraculi TaxID=2021971 RepID=UPI000E721B29|nr:fructose-6-phosphate aldolase [Streptococcus respiraculi]
MKLILDTANQEKIKEYLTYLPVSGVTTNPSIVKKEGEIDFFEHMREIRQLIGFERSLHVQVIAQDYEGMLADAHRLVEEIDNQIFIKVPVTKEGLRAIKTLKKAKLGVTATAIYTEMQALLALESGADFLAPYVNRISSLNGDAFSLISHVQKEIERTQSSTQILAASFKQVGQVLDAVHAGASCVTVGTDVLDQFLVHPSIDQAVADFARDWESNFGRNSI